MNRRSVYLLAGISFWAARASAETSYEYAPVLESRPVYQLIAIEEPVEQCWEEEVAVERYAAYEGSNTPVLLSTVIGGAIGNAVGNGKSNKRVGAVVGALLGHSVGRDIVRRNQGVIREVELVQRCETAYEQVEEERLVGYQVTYLYNGDEYSVRTDTDPGDQIRLRVSVQPEI